MKKLLASSKVYISKSKIFNAGRGVFARCDIKKGEIVESCPIIEVSENDTSNLKESVLVTYFFYFGKNKEKIAMVLGFGSLYNHSYKPNTTYKMKPREKTIEFVAINNIKKDDEITFNYSNSAKPQKGKKDPLWFEANG